jgi:hypothetical protein
MYAYQALVTVVVCCFQTVRRRFDRVSGRGKNSQVFVLVEPRAPDVEQLEARKVREGERVSC